MSETDGNAEREELAEVFGQPDEAVAGAVIGLLAGGLGWGIAGFFIGRELEGEF